MRVPLKLNLYYIISESENYTINLNAKKNISFDYVYLFPLYEINSNKLVGSVKLLGNQIDNPSGRWNNYEFIIYLSEYNSSLNANYNFKSQVINPPTPLPSFETKITSISGPIWRRQGILKFITNNNYRYLYIEFNCGC